MQLVNVHNKTVVSISDGKTYGKVSGLYVHRDTYEPVLIHLTGESDFLLRPADMYSVADVITTLSVPETIDTVALTDFIYLHIGIRLFDCKGLSIGKLSDYPVRAAYKNQRLIAVGSHTYSPSKIVAANEVLVLNLGRQLPPVKKPKKSIVSVAAAKTADVTPLNTPSRAAIALNKDYSFLVGRVTKRAITDLNGIVLIAVGTAITHSVIEFARQCGKLSELLINSR